MFRKAGVARPSTFFPGFLRFGWSLVAAIQSSFVCPLGAQTPERKCPPPTFFRGTSPASGGLAAAAPGAIAMPLRTTGARLGDFVYPNIRERALRPKALSGSPPLSRETGAENRLSLPDSGLAPTVPPARSAREELLPRCGAWPYLRQPALPAVCFFSIIAIKANNIIIVKRLT